jgi:phage-related holin
MKDWIVATALSLLGIFAPIKALFLVAGFLIFADLLTGIIAAHKRGEKVKSSAMRRTITKCFVYQSAILIGFLIEQFMLDGFIPVSKIAAGLISVVEGKSIFENLDSINGSPVFKALVVKLGSVNDIDKAAAQVQKEEKKDGESL